MYKNNKNVVHKKLSYGSIIMEQKDGNTAVCPHQPHHVATLSHAICFEGYLSSVATNIITLLFRRYLFRQAHQQVCRDQLLFLLP